MNGAVNESYGTYEVPKEIFQLIELEKELQKERLSLARIGLIPVEQFDSYAITPPDVIVFAETGGGGIHFGFLTDFSSVSNLNEAPIVCVTPTNYPPIRLVARNIQEFLNLASSVPYVEMLESLWAIIDSERVTELFRDFEKDSSSKGQKERETIFSRFRKTLGTQPMEVLPYLSAVKKERSASIGMQSLDELGVVLNNSEVTSWQSFTFSQDHSCDEEEIGRMRLFLSQANEVEKLAFVRDANYWYVVSSGYDEAVWELLIELLTSMNLHDAAERISERC
ncbi:MAG TPA: hypothetical protein VLQ66_02905 [Paenisporosarcina sp.]|nr:hypothetical protein [Paenisporosarcina sp.]